MGNWEGSILAEDLKELINCVIVYKTFVSENRKNIDYKGDDDRKHIHYIAGSRDKINLQIFCNEREW